MVQKRSPKPRVLIVAVLALLAGTFVSTNEVLEASRDEFDAGQFLLLMKQPVFAPARKDLPLTSPIDTSEEVDEAESRPTFPTHEALAEAPWAPGVTIEIDSDQLHFQSNGLPNHEFPDDYLEPGTHAYGEPLAWRTPEPGQRTLPVVATVVDQTITVQPALAEIRTPAPEGVIGVLISGAQVINDSDEISWQHLTTYEYFFVDACNGHPTTLQGRSDAVGNYHYHAVPRCTTDAVDIEGQHSSIVGVMIDGFPIYGSNDTGGEPITRRDLDACSGHFGPTPEFPEGIYHYHFLDEIGATPFRCLSGVLDAASVALPFAPVDR